METKQDFIESIKKRTKDLSISILKLYDKIHKTDSILVIGRQIIKSSTSTAANYRAACIARSKKEFSKMSIVADETVFWLEILLEANLATPEEINPLLNEAIQISKIVATARKNTTF
tara:strand:+ start:6209 stop:6559 length:351 start_codon:yes stop_codon:yes gene_type:complete